MSNFFTFTIADNFDELSALCQQIHCLLEKRNILPKKIYAVMLALEEMITNTIKYGYDDDDEHQITVKLTLDTDVKLLIEDKGHEFDPLKNQPDSLSAGIEERQVGGMGIHLTKNMVKSISYCRSNETNIITLTI